MYQPIPQTPSHTRAFTACLLSFMILMAPLASVAAATLRVTAPKPGKPLTAAEKLEASLFEPALAPVVVGPVINATKVDSFPAHPSGQAEPGDAITYDVNIANTGSDATSVQFNDTIDPNTTLVPGSLKVSPLAFADTYVAEKNVALSVSAPGVLTNDTGTPTPTAVPIAAGPTTQAGTVTLNSDGSFNYTPPSNFTGTDTFTYTATNGLTPNDTATVTITVDARPAVTTTTPTNSATNQATNTNIVINFSEAVNATTSSFTIECPAPGNTQAFAVSGSGTSAITLDPTADLPAGTTCKVTVIANQISDTDTNDPPDNLSADFVFSFTTDAAPSVSSTTPTNGAPGVATNTTITVNFSESVAATTSSFTLECPTGTAKTFTLSASPSTSFTLTPSAALPVGTTCTVTVIAAQIHDTDTNDPPDIMAANYVFSFTTDAPPSVSSTTPTDTATGLGTNTTITVNFSESVNATTSSFTIKCPSGGAALPYTLSSSPSTSFTLTPNAALPAGTTCQVTVLAAQITDTDTADPPDNMTANYVFNFTTDAAPTVNSITPANAATQIANNANVSVTFSEPVNVTGNWFQVVCGTSGTHDTSNSVVTGGPTTFTINPTDFTNGEACTVTVFAAQVTDQDSGDPPDNMAANFVSTFTIDQAPSVTTTVPANNATGVALNATITVNFSESVNASLSSFTLNCSVAGSRAFTLSASPASSFTLTPTGGLPAGDTCTVNVVASQITDTDAGDPPDNMVADFPFTFKVNPDAVNDNLQTATGQSVIGNVSFNAANIPYSVSSNDISATAFTVTAFDAASANGGTVSVAANGQFTYNPPRGFEGTDTFNYTISRSDGGGSDTATVTVTVSGMIWFINNNAGACSSSCDGRLSNPYTTLAAFNTANALAGGLNPDNNDNIFIYESATGYTGAVTLRTGQKLIGQDASSSLSTITGLTPPSGSTSFPVMNNGNATVTNVNASVSLANNAQVIGLDMDGATAALSGSSNTGFTVDLNRFRRTASGVALSLAGSGNTGNYTFKSLSAAGAAGGGNKGVTVSNLTGTFTVLGTDSLTPTGGTVSGYGSNGVEFINVNNGSSTGISLTKMTLNANGVSQTVAGSAATCGGDLHSGNNLSCVSNLFIRDSNHVVLDQLTVSNSGQVGINGNNITHFTLTNSSVTGNGNEAFESGVVIQNLLGTGANSNLIQDCNIRDNAARQIHVDSASGSTQLDVKKNTGTMYMGYTSRPPSGGTSQQGLLVDVNNTFTLNVDQVTVKNNVNNGVDFLGRSSAVLNGHVNNSVFDINGAAVDLQTIGGNTTFDVTNNSQMTGNLAQAINVANGAGATGTLLTKITGNTIGIFNNSTGASACDPTAPTPQLNCTGIAISEFGGTVKATVTGNQLHQVSGTGMNVTASGGTTAVTISGNTIDQPGNIPLGNPLVPAGNAVGNAILVNMGSLAAVTACADITSNTFNATDFFGTGFGWDPNGSGTAILIRTRNSSVTSIPNLTGGTTAANVANYISTHQTSGGTTTAQAQTAGTFAVGGANCGTPLLLAPGGVESRLNSLFVPLRSGLSQTSALTNAGSGARSNDFSFSTVKSANGAVYTRREAPPVSTSLNQQQLDSIVSSAINHWAATGLTPQQIDTLRGLRFDLADLDGSYIGESDGNRILVDRDASGKGWYIGSDWSSDSLFSRTVSTTRRYTDPMSAPAGHLDLLTAIEHEMGHKLGLPDSYAAKDRDNVMYGYLTVGERRLPAPGQARGANPNALGGTHFLSLSHAKESRQIRKNHATNSVTTPLAPPPPPTISQSIGTLKAGKTVHIQFQVTVNSPFPSGTTQVSNQGTVTFIEPGSPVLTDDPAVAGATDPTVTLISAGANAVNDSYSTFKNVPLNVAAPGVLTNDTGTPTVTAVVGCSDTTDPFTGCATTAGGTVTVNGDGSFSYTPPSATFLGNDTFDYTATNGAGSDNATVTITVAEGYLNEILFNPPGTDAPNEYIELRGTPNALIPAGTYIVVVDGDGASLGDVTAIINLSGLTFGANGYLVLLQNGNSYTTAAGATVVTSTSSGFGGLGLPTLARWSADGGATDLKQGSVSFLLVQTNVVPLLTDDIDTSPTAAGDGTPDGSVYAGWNVIDSIGVITGSATSPTSYAAFNFSNPPLGYDPIYVGRATGDTTGSTASDWVTTGALSGGPPPAAFTLSATNTAPVSYVGRALDHIGSTNFPALNQAPVNSVPGAQNIPVNSTRVFSTANGNLISISDADAGTANVKVSLTATNGTMTLSGITGLNFTTGDGTADASMVFTGTITNINNALNGMSFTPTPAFSGTASIQIVTDDQGNTGAGGAQTDTDSITINVSANTPPTANPQTVSTAEDTPLPITLTGTDPETPGSLTFAIVSGPSNGTLNPGTTGAAQTYTPAANYNGPDSFTFKVNDGTADSTPATVSITVNAVNDPPSFTKGADQNVNEDAGAQSVTNWATAISAGPNESGQTLTFQVTNNTNSALFSVQPAVSSTGTLTYTPAANASGSAAITIVLKDNGGGADTSAPQIFNIVVNSSNDAPVNTVPGAQSVTENGSLTFSAANSNAISIADVDAGTNAVQVQLTATNGVITLSGISGLSFTVGDGTADATMTFTGTIANINAALNGMVFTPTPGYFGAASVAITTNDQGNSGAGGALSDTDTVNINVDNTQVIQFNSATYTINEGAVNTPEGFASLTVQVDRTGDLSGASTVRYATADLSGNNECTVTNGNASQRCDYLMLSGTLRFAAGEGTKTFQIPIVNDGYVEGSELFTIQLSNVTGTAATLGAASLTTVTITDDDIVATDAAHNPYLSNSFFVRMHYVDFLEREPDTAGFNDWVGVLNGCGPQHGFLGAPSNCDRAHISKGFFGSMEFIDRGFLVYRLYDLGLNRLPLYTEYNADSAQLRGFGLSTAEQQQNLNNYLLDLGSRTEFVNRYAGVATTGQATQLIQLLEMTAGVTLPATATTLTGQPPQYGRADLISKRSTGQFSVVETVKAFVEQKVVYDKYFPRGFVTMQYFAYLHRDPDAAGWNDWLDVLVNGRPSLGVAPGDYNRLIFGFIYSTEYRKRFGQP